MKKLSKLFLIMLVLQIVLLMGFDTKSVAVSDDKNIEEGIYKIVLAESPEQGVAIQNGSSGNGANVEIQKYQDMPYQEFKFVYDKDGYYEIIAVNSGKRLDVCGWGNGVNIEQWNENKNTDSQKWKIQKNDNGNYNIISKRQNIYLTAHNSGTTNGTNIEGYEKNGSTGQEFKLEKIEKIEEGTYKIALASSKTQCVTVDDEKGQNGANVNIQKYSYLKRQQFELKYNNQGYIEITAVYSGKKLDVCGWGNGVNIEQWNENKVSDSQKWIIKKNSNGNFNIISQRNHLYLTAHNSGTANGTNIEGYEKNGSTGQEFVLEKVTKETIPAKKTIENGIYRIYFASNSEQGVSIQNGSTANGANVQIQKYQDMPYQEFNFVYDGNGYYEIIAVNSGKRLDVCGWGNGTNVELWPENKNTDSQKWIVYKNSAGNYNIISKRQSLYLTAHNSNTSNGTNIEVFEKNGGKGQEFGLEKIEKIAEGKYEIALASAPEQSVSISDGSKENGANVNIQKCTNKKYQQFEIKYTSDGYIQLIVAHSGKMLDVCGWGNGANVEQWTENKNTDSQKWVIKKNANGNYNIISQRNNLYLTAHNSETANGTNIEGYEKNGSKGQEFIIEEAKEAQIVPKKTVEEGTYKITLAKNSKQSVTVENGSSNNDANIQIWEYGNLAQQEFNLVYDGNGYYEIIPINSGKRLDVCGWGNGANVKQWGRNTGTDSQKWIIYENSDGYYNLISKRQDLYLTVHNSESSNGANIEAYEKKDDDSQNFNLEKVSNKSEKLIESGRYQLKAKANLNMVLDVAGADKNNNATVQVWQNGNSKWQKLNLEYENGYYKISMGHSGKYLTTKSDKLQNNIEIVQDDWNNKQSQKWGIRDNGNGSVSIYSMANYDLVFDMRNKIDNGTIIQLYENVGGSNQEFCFVKTTWITVDEAKYPGVQTAIDNLMSAHPNWEFEILYTGLDFNTVVKSEYEYEGKRGNLVDMSTYRGNWVSEEPYVSGIWASASYNAIAYFMDIRNFLNDIDVFQFVDLGNYEASGATLDSIQYQVNGTFLNDYAKDVQNACKNTNINPYYILARLFQEQGADGSGTINMDGGDGKRYFNPFNVGAQVGNDIQTALDRAKQEGWDSMQKGLEGGIKIIKKRYIDAKQNTLYLNKFDVNPASGGGFYSNQYMQNLSAAYSEASVFRSSYTKTGTVDNNIKFIVPVYENMASTPAEKPTGEGETPLPYNKGPKSVKITTTNMGLAVRDKASTSNSKVLARYDSGTILLSVERLSNGWHKVVTPDGRKGYSSGSYLEVVDDETNCNDKMVVKTSDGKGVNLRIGPGTEYETSRKLSDGTKVTRIVTNKYNFGYWWDEVILSDGAKGFIATNYLIYDN